MEPSTPVKGPAGWLHLRPLNGKAQNSGKNYNGPFPDLFAVVVSECVPYGKSGDLPTEPGAALVGRPKVNP
jgi:hypothetical protein